MQSYYANQMNYQQTQQYLNSVSNTLFVADLPDECCEEDLSAFFKDYNFSWAKVMHSIMRTHAFVNFNTKDDAEKARNELNGVKICPKYSKDKIAKPVRICKYETKSYYTEVDKRCNLLVKNLSKNVGAHLLFKTFRKYGDIRSSKLMVDFFGNTKGFGFVSFYKVDDSLRAKNELDGKEIEGKNIKVNFLERGRVHEIKKNNIYVKEIPKKNFDNKDLENLFSKFGEIKSAIVLKDEKNESKGFGFVCFNKAEDAEKALKEMNDKKIFPEQEKNLYVSFAMKKGERREALLKKREELYKLSQKMTVYAKIKNENHFNEEKDFIDTINNYLKQLLNENYKPKNIKVRYETKNAFITMNSQEDAKNFIKAYQDYSKLNETDIYFNLYKSKIDRITNTYYKKYNQFSDASSLSSGKNARFKNYNDFNMIPQIQEGTKYNSYNNFTQVPINQMPIQPQRFVQYNTFDIQQTNPTNTKTNTNTNINANTNTNIPQITDKYEACDYIYSIVESKYKDQAPKITGMLYEFDFEKLKRMILQDRNELMAQIEKAHNLLLQSK